VCARGRDRVCVYGCTVLVFASVPVVTFRIQPLRSLVHISHLTRLCLSQNQKKTDKCIKCPNLARFASPISVIPPLTNLNTVTTRPSCPPTTSTLTHPYNTHVVPLAVSARSATHCAKHCLAGVLCVSACGSVRGWVCVFLYIYVHVYLYVYIFVPRTVPSIIWQVSCV